MKKINLVLLSVFTLLFGVLISACDFKKVEASFSQEELVLSVGETKNLEDYVIVKEAKQNELGFKFSNQDLFEVNGTALVAKKAGASNVYATYKDNVLATMKIVVKQKFVAPSQFEVDGKFLSWNIPAGFVEGNNNPQKPTSYLVEGVCQIYSAQNPDQLVETKTISQTVNTNSFEFTDSGKYILTVIANSSNYFDASEKSVQQTFSYGYMDKLTAQNLTWNVDGTLSWKNLVNSKFKVKFDNAILETDEIKDASASSLSLSLKMQFENAKSGAHTLSVIAFDTNGVKLAQESESITVVKLAQPQVEYVWSRANGGQLEITTQKDVEKYQISLSNGQNIEVLNSSEKLLTSLEGLQSGTFTADVVALCDEGNFYQSDILQLGQIYKLPKVTLTGRGENSENGNVIKLNAKATQSLYPIDFKLYGLGETKTVKGFDENIVSLDFEVELNESAQLKLFAFIREKPQELIVLNSDFSDTLILTKVNSFAGEITHAYEEEKSVLTFNKIENATDYALQIFNGSDFEAVEAEFVVQDEVVKFVLTDKIENLFESIQLEAFKGFRFKVVAKTADDKLAINSTKEKQIQMLDVPEALDREDALSKTYAWQAVENADAYSLEIYKISKEEYLANTTNVTLSNSGATKIEVSQPQYTLSEEGYYFIKIFAVSKDENEILSSKECLKKVFYIAKQLEISEVNFGKDDAYVGYSEFTTALGYYLSLDNTENVDSFEITLSAGNASTFKISQAEKSVFLLSEGFESENFDYVISVVGKSSTDPMIYLDSEEKTLTVKRLKKTIYSDLQFDDKVDNVTVVATEGVNGIVVEDATNDDTVSVEGQNATMSIAGKTNFTLNVTLYGSEQVQKIYQKQNETIYLDSAETRLNFVRLETPTQMIYQNSNLVFEHSAISNVNYYVLNISCTTANGTENFAVQLGNAGTTAKIFAGGQEYEIGTADEFRENSGSQVTIKLAKLIEVLKTDKNLSQLYSQAISLDFEVFGYLKRIETDRMLLSSLPSSLKNEIEKIASPALSMRETETNFVLEWNAVSTTLGSAISSQTTYEIYRKTNGEFEKLTQVTGATAYSLAKTDFNKGVYYQYYIKATNPYYLESSNSNSIRIYLLSSLKSAILTNDGKLQLAYNSAEQDFYQNVKFKVNSADEQELTSNEIALTQAGNYSVKCYGKTVVESDLTTYYIDSESSTWTLENMQTLKPSDETVSYSNNLISFNAFGAEKGLSTLRYLIIFKDSSGKTAVYQTTETSVDLKNNTQVLEIIEALQAGEIEVQVSAFLDSYNVLAGQTVYYAPQTVLLNDSNEWNHYIYDDSLTITKKTTPNITNIEFVYNNDQANVNYLTDAQTPKIKVTFEGNYQAGEEYSVYLNDSDAPILTSTISSTTENSFEIGKELYNNGLDAGQTLKISVKVFGENVIPSSKGSQEILRAVNVTRVELVKEETLTHNLKVSFDAQKTEFLSGGLVLKFEIGGSKIIYKAVDVAGVDQDNNFAVYDINASEFSIIKPHLSNGGKLKISAFINNYANAEDKKYYLASPLSMTTQTYNVLAGVNSVARKEGGFEIDASLNNSSTIYVVSYGEENYEVKAQDGKFYFEIPQGWSDNAYTLKIFAKEDGFVNSVVNEIEFNLQRIDGVQEVSIQRKADELSEIVFTWGTKSGDNIVNIPDANGYIIRAYDKENDELICESQLTTNSATLSEIFGKNYQKFLDAGFDQSKFLSDISLRIEFITIGNSDKNNSYAYSFDAQICANQLLVPANISDCITVDEYGFIAFESQAGKTYAYRFVNPLGQQLQDWKIVEATGETTKVDASELEFDAMENFEIEIIAFGSAQTDKKIVSSDFGVVLDSYYATTVQNTLTFKMNDKIASVGYVADLPSSLAFKMASDAFENEQSKIYAGLSENALKDGEVVNFVPEKTEITAEAGLNFFSYSPADLIDLFAQAGQIFPSGDVKVYFWAFKATEEESSSYTISKPCEFVFAFSNDAGFKNIVKLGKNDGTNPNYDGLSFAKGYEDFANTFAVFENNDSLFTGITLGIYVKITAVNEDFSASKFVSSLQMNNSQYFTDSVYSINLTALFEEENLKSAKGDFKIEFSRVEYANNKFKLSQWQTQDLSGNDLIFKRLAPVENVKISGGNVVWKDSADQALKFYVYFAEDENLKNNYSYYSTSKTSFDASSYMAEQDKYYICVQEVSEQLFELPAVKVFILGEDEDEAQVYKNRIKNKLQLKNGKFFIEFTEEDDFYQLLTNAELTDEAIALELSQKTFTAPFTFNLKDLLNNEIKIRLKFTKLVDGSEGMAEFFDINAKYLLSNLYDLDATLEDKLQTIFQNVTSENGVKTLIDKLIDFVGKGSYGVANSTVLFDDLFERLQMGGYKLEYCLLGNDYSLASQWYSFENSVSENVVYINAEPQVKAIQVDSTDKSINTYKLLIKQSQIYAYVDGNYIAQPAENYILKLIGDKEFVFEITKGISSHSLTLKGDEKGRSVSVYYANAQGEVVSGGDYLMIYLNLNNANSILGQFGDELVKRAHKMQIYAVGNDVSASSKSDLFNLSLLGFGQNMKLVNGTFIWTAQSNRSTSVIFKRSTSQEEEEIGVSGDGVYSSFALENVGADLCSYIKFVMKGEVDGHNIFVDSEIYQVDNVYKLNAPRLSNVLGEIQIDDSSNVAWLNECFVKENESKYNYQIHNNVSTALQSQIISNTTLTSVVNYQVGTTDLDETNPDFAYKATELQANKFFVASLGTTANLSAVRDADSYYKFKLYCVEKEASGSEPAVLSSKRIALKSASASIDAQMLDTPQEIRVEDGLLKWDAVEGVADLKVPQINSVKTIYKVVVAQYKLAEVDGDEIQTNVGEIRPYFTANTYFDFAKITHDQIVELEEKTYLKVVVQALALTTTNTETANSVRLIEGGFAYGDVSYENSSIKILKSNGAKLEKIDRLESIDKDSLKVANGSLAWTYTTEAEVTTENFFDIYDFVVEDNTGRQVKGKCSAILQEQKDDKNIFAIVFEEEKGALPAGENELFVYAVQGANNENVVIKSFARSIAIRKLRTIARSDFVVESFEEYEVFDLSNYFADGNTNFVYPYITINEEEKDFSGFAFSASRPKLYVFFSNPSSINYPEDFINNYIIVGNEDIAKLNFKIQPNTLDSYTLFSDLSDDVILQRTSLEESQIVWDEDQQIFTWQYNGFYSFDETVTAESVRSGYITRGNVRLYSDENREQEAMILPTNTEIEVVETLPTATKILYQEQEYYVANNAYQQEYFKVEDVEIAAGTLYKVVQENASNAIINVDENIYRLRADALQKPIYVVEAIYGDSPSEIKRVYTTTQNYFEPTIIGKVTISVKIKLGEKNLQSQVLHYATVEKNEETEEEMVTVLQADFNLFADGAGTSANPYKIETAEQFLNISKRMTKGNYLKSYYSAGETIEENEVFNFTLAENSQFDLGEHSGIIFSGDFDGIITGQNSTLNYQVSNVSRLQNTVTVSDGLVLSSGTATQTNFTRGASLFEKFNTSASVSNLKLNAIFGKTGESVAVTNDTLISSLVIVNNGKVDNVELLSFENSFYGLGSGTTRMIMVYSGIVSINEGANATVSSCKVSAERMVVFNSSQPQIIFLSGIAFTNYAIIDACVIGSGQMIVDCSSASNIIQLAGIATTNASTATIRNCVNNALMSVQGVQPMETNYTTVFMAGIVDLGLGTLTNNTFTKGLDGLTTSNILSDNLKSGVIYAENRRTR